MEEPYISARDVAEALRISVQAVHQRAKRQDWRARIINKRGDRLFLVRYLPADVRAAIDRARRPAPSTPTLAEMARGYLNFWANIFRALGRAFAWACEYRL